MIYHTQNIPIYVIMISHNNIRVITKNSGHWANYFRDSYNAHITSWDIFTTKCSVLYWNLYFFVIIAISHLSSIENEQFTITTWNVVFDEASHKTKLCLCRSWLLDWGSWSWLIRNIAHPDYNSDFYIIIIRMIAWRIMSYSFKCTYSFLRSWIFWSVILCL